MAPTAEDLGLRAPVRSGGRRGQGGCRGEVEVNSLRHRTARPSRRPQRGQAGADRRGLSSRCPSRCGWSSGPDAVLAAATELPPGLALLDLDLGRDGAGRRIDGLLPILPGRGRGPRARPGLQPACEYFPPLHDTTADPVFPLRLWLCADWGWPSWPTTRGCRRAGGPGAGRADRSAARRGARGACGRAAAGRGDRGRGRHPARRLLARRARAAGHALGG
jgi:hypothetical protein